MFSNGWLFQVPGIYNMYLWAPMTSIFVEGCSGQALKRRPFPSNTRVIWVLGMYAMKSCKYIYIIYINPETNITVFKDNTEWMPLSKSSVPNCLQLLCRSFVPVPIFVDRIPFKLAPLGRRGLRSGREKWTQNFRSRGGQGSEGEVSGRGGEGRRTWTST